MVSACVRFEPSFVYARSHVAQIVRSNAYGGDGEEEKKMNKERDKVVHGGPHQTWRIARTRPDTLISSHMWAEFEGLRTARTYEDDMGGPVEWLFPSLSCPDPVRLDI